MSETDIYLSVKKKLLICGCFHIKKKRNKVRDTVLLLVEEKGTPLEVGSVTEDRQSVKCFYKFFPIMEA